MNDAPVSDIPLMSPAEIRQLRRDLGWTQTYMARYLHVAYSTIGRWEAGKMAPSGYLRHRLHELREANPLRL